jgi:uncharacterized repeat protein (TIGR03843 family)
VPRLERSSPERVSEAARPAVDRPLDLLATGEIEVLGLLPYSSNYVFLAKVCKAGSEAHAIYKPRRGERPLWDFPQGTLAAREVAAFRLSEAGGWNIVPPTVLRPDGPLGAGSLQLFIEHDPERHYFALLDERPKEFVTFAAFDVVINNADRKGGHVLEDESGRLWGVDHGVTFHAQEKLRTVIWHLAGQPLGAGTVELVTRTGAALRRSDGLGGELSRLLSKRETAATIMRVERLLAIGKLPSPGSDYHLPWPLV